MKDNSEAYNENQIIEGNVLIAEFLGGIEIYDATNTELLWSQIANFTLPRTSQLKYHSSWDWLMPVVSRCYDLSYLADGKKTNVIRNITIELLKCDIHKEWAAVVAFIEWYNYEKHNK
jgi:hypothetical protein